MNRWKIPLLRALPFALLIFAMGCIAVQELALYAERPIRFSHAVHGTKADLTCDKCHVDAKNADTVGMPAPQKCVLCHNNKEAYDAKLKPFLVEKKVKWTQATQQIGDIKFAHNAHLAKNVSCVACHQDIESSEAISPDLKMSMNQCMTCHQQRSVSNACITCHKEQTPAMAPVTHKINWQQGHGKVAHSGSMDGKNQCSVCHTASSCTSCHETTQPKTHTEYWKIKGHAISASIDRETCNTCHKPDSCNTCHSQTAPRSHLPSWGAPRDNHCQTCHEPLKQESCALCHTGTPSHSLAVAKPAWHSSAMNCRQCHGPGLSQPLPHFDNGDNCNACHH